MVPDDCPPHWSIMDQGTDENDEWYGSFVNDDETVVVTIREAPDPDDGGDEFRIFVDQHVEADSYATEINTHVWFTESRSQAEADVMQFMTEYNGGAHGITAIGAKEWREFVQFYCISDSQLPDDMRADVLVEAIESGEAVEQDISDVEPDDTPDEDIPTIDIEIFPRHEASVQSVADEQQSDGDNE